MDIWRRMRALTRRKQPLVLYNTLTKRTEEFSLPSHARYVRMYNCGPTVYDVAHIGNLRSYIFADILRRTLEYNNLKVKQVVNITDFGHLSSDADAGPDKMTKALKREGLELTMDNMHALAERYAERFIDDLDKLGVDTGRIIFPRASEHIQAEIALIRTLEEKGYTYRGQDGVYYDTSRFVRYGQLGDIDMQGLKAGARVKLAEDKRHPTDFLLWKLDKSMGWESPWGKGFPGWHIECSAMINATLGKQIDIHTGGIDLMPTHHNNEIAQSEAATGKRPFSRFWMHHAFLNINSERIAKSAGNMINLSDILSKGFHPLAYRYFLLGAHYKTPMDFTWEALGAAQGALARLVSLRVPLKDRGSVSSLWQAEFLNRINNDLDTPGALAVLWEMMKDKALSPAERLATLLDFDRVLGLSLENPDGALQKLAAVALSEADIPLEIRQLLEKRAQARADKEWDLSDRLRQQAAERGFTIEDQGDGSQRVLRRSD